MFKKTKTTISNVRKPLKVTKYTTIANPEVDKRTRILRTINDGDDVITRYNMSGTQQIITDIFTQYMGEVCLYNIRVRNKYGNFMISGTLDNLKIFERNSYTDTYLPSLNTLDDFGIEIVDGQVYYTVSETTNTPVDVEVGDIYETVKGGEWEVLMICPDGSLVLYGRGTCDTQTLRSVILNERDKTFVESLIGIKKG